MDKKIIGIDLGGTTIKFAILTTDGVVQQKWSIETNILEDGKHIVPSIIESIRHRIDLYNMKKEEVGRLTEQRALDTLTEKIESFEIEGNDKEQITLYLYPLQLGRLAMISRRLIDLDLIFDDEQMEGAVKRMWTICSEKSKEVAEIIAIATLRTQQEIEDMLKERTKLIYWSPTMDTTALTNILSTIVFQSYYADFMNAIRLVRTLRVMISPTTTAERIATTEGAVSGDK